MNLTQRIKLLKHFGSVPPEPPPPLLVVPKPGMEELTIWEQHTITLNKDPKLGFGFAISGGKDKPHPDGDTAVVVSDVLPNGPAMGRLFNKDQIVMVNGTSMENVHSNFTIQVLKSCGKTANITIKRPRKIQIPATTRPTRAASQSNLLDHDPPRRPRRYSDGSDNRDTGRHRARSATPDRNGHGNTLPLMSSGYKRLPHQDVADKPIRTTLVKKKITDEYGLKLGSQIFIKHMTETGLAAKEGTLQEGDLILKINGMTTENLSLLETKHLVEKSRGKLTMTVLRDDRKFLVSIPEVEDSAPTARMTATAETAAPSWRVREGKCERGSSKYISDLDADIPIRRTARQPTREKRTRRTRAEPPPAKSRDSSPVRSTLSRPPARNYASRRAPYDSESDHSTSPPPVRRDRDSPEVRISPAATTHAWTASRPPSNASRPRRPVSESDSDRSAPLLHAKRARGQTADTKFSLICPTPSLFARSHHGGSALLSESHPQTLGLSRTQQFGPPQRHSTSHSQDSLSRYRVLPEVARSHRWSHRDGRLRVPLPLIQILSQKPVCIRPSEGVHRQWKLNTGNNDT
ncbi:hypothetical protein INR49_030244, partial [Caranx melampygus]